jgi:hypothetical protein
MVPKTRLGWILLAVAILIVVGLVFSFIGCSSTDVGTGKL